MNKQILYSVTFVLVVGLLVLISNDPFVFAKEENSENKNKPFVMASIVSRDSNEGKGLYLAYSEAFNRLGLKLEFRHYPSKRASFMADHHKVEGELARSFNYGKNHPALIRVDEPITSTLTIALATDSSIKLNGWESLRNTTFRVEYLRGSQRTHDRLTEFVKPEQLSSISDWSQGLNKLKYNRTDVFVVPEIVAKNLFQRDEFQNSGIVQVGIMEKITIHAYLHRTHMALAPQLSATLKDMKKRGLIEKYKAISGAQ